MRVVIPGGSGQVGTILARAFHRDGHDVVVLSRRPQTRPWRVVKWDGATLGYYRKVKVRVDTLDGDVLAWLYVLNFYEGGLPSARNVGILADAAETAGAPADYVAALRALPCAKLGESNSEQEPPWT